MKLIVGDAFDPGLGLEGFEGIVVDPPYNKSTASNSPVEGRLGCPTFSNEAMLELATRVTITDAFLVVTTNYPNGAELFALSKSSPWTWRATQVWDKRPTRTWVSWSLPLKCVEYINYYTRGKFRFSFKDGTVKPKVNRKSFGGSMKKSTPNKAEVSYGMFEEIVAMRSPRRAKRIHPTQKPVEMSEMLALLVGAESRVLDPFCGSGALLSAFPNSVGVDLKDWAKAKRPPPPPVPKHMVHRDPHETEVQAAKVVLPRVGSIRARVLRAVEAAGDNGLTAAEFLVSNAEMRHSTARTRFSELFHSQLIKPSGLTRKNERENNETVWVRSSLLRERRPPPPPPPKRVK